MNQKEYKTTHPKTRAAWRKWLERNHAKTPGIWLIFYRKSSGKAKLFYADAVEEALCFGWIDSTNRKLDGERFMQRFTPRRRGSGWSGSNKERVKRLMDLGFMMPAGMTAVETAKKDGSWEKLDRIYAPESGLIIPGDLRQGLDKNRKAAANFAAFPLFTRRQFLYWIHSARRAETRKTRIKQTIRMAAVNKKPGIKGFVL